MILPDEVMELFFLEWPKNPELLNKNRDAMGVSHKVAEQAAWCMEFNDQIAFLANQLGLTIVLMGGNGVSLRLDATKQRGSADNDYLTDATPEDIEDLMGALEDRFAAAPEPFFRPSLLEKPEGAQDLALQSYIVRVPDLLPGNNSLPESGESFVKLEFHMKNELPETEELPERHWSTHEKIDLHGPTIPYQIALKLITLIDPPIGIEAHRFEAVPKHLYDTDVLFAMLFLESDWDAVSHQLIKQYHAECADRDLIPASDEPFGQISKRLDEWKQCRDKSTRYWQTIESMQSSQMQKRNRMIPELWSARCARLDVLNLLLADQAAHGMWLEILASESKVPERPQGKALKRARTAAKKIASETPATDSLRAMFWPHVANSKTPDEAVARAEAFGNVVDSAIRDLE